MRKKNNTVSRPIALFHHHPESERAEFAFKANHSDSYDFLSLLYNKSYDSISQEYKEISQQDNDNHPWRQRHKWKVGMAADDIHWGVYISRCPPENGPKDDSSSKRETDNNVPPVGIYKVYGANWSGKKDQAMHLQAVWSSQGMLKRDLTKDELKFVTKRNTGYLFKEALYDETEMYFSWPEFVLVAQFVLQEWLLKHTAKVDTTTLSSKQREDLVQENNTPAAYSIFSNNCRHFSGQLIQRMLQNRWTERSRLKFPFCFRELSAQWRTLTNTWATMSIPQTRVISKAGSKSQNTKQPNPTTNRSSDLKMIRDKLPRRKRFRWRKLKTQLDGDQNAIDMAISFIIAEGISIKDYLKLLDSDETARAVSTIEEELQHASIWSPKALLQSWVVAFRKMWESESTAFELLLFLSCTAGHKVHNELLPRSGTLKQDISALKARGMLEATETKYITVRFPIWEIMIFGISVWERCNQGTLPSARKALSGEQKDRDLKFRAAQKAITHLHSLARRAPSNKEWWPRNEKHIREILREWQDDHSQHTEETSAVSQFVGQNLVRCGETEQAIHYLRFTSKFCEAWKREPADRTKYHFAQLELCRALRHDETSDSSLKEIKEMLKKNESLQKYLKRKSLGKPVVNLSDIWNDEWQYVPDLCLELALVYINTGKPKKACDVLEQIAVQFDNDFPCDSGTSSGVSAKTKGLLVKAGGQSKASTRADKLYQALQSRLDTINQNNADGSRLPSLDIRSPSLSQVLL